MGVFGSIFSGLIGASASRSASRDQVAAADKQVELARETRDLTRADLSPFVSGGVRGQNALMYELGLAERPTFGATPLSVTEEQYSIPGEGMRIHERTGDPVYTQNPTTGTRYNVNGLSFDDRDTANTYAAENGTGGFEYQGYEQTPGYDFRLNQGLDAIASNSAMRGGIGSGAMQQRLLEYGQDYATNDYSNYLNRLTGFASNGQNAAGAQAASNQFYSQQAGNAYGAMGNAQAAGAIGVGNALQGGIQNGMGWLGYQRAQGQGAGSNWLFGGNSWG